MPTEQNTPDIAGTITLPIPSNPATSTACTGPDPPNAISAMSRGSRPRSTVTERMALAMATFAILRIPAAACTTSRPSGVPI